MSQNYHIKFSCTRILAHFLKQQRHARGYFYPLYRARAVHRRISALTTYSKAKSRAIERTDCSPKTRENIRTGRGSCLWFLGRCSAPQWHTSRNISLHSKSKTRGTRASFSRLECAVEEKENDMFHDGRNVVSNALSPSHRRMQNS